MKDNNVLENNENKEHEKGSDTYQGQAEHAPGSATQGGSNYGQGSSQLGNESFKQGSEKNKGSNYDNEKGFNEK